VVIAQGDDLTSDRAAVSPVCVAAVVPFVAAVVVIVMAAMVAFPWVLPVAITGGTDDRGVASHAGQATCI
jgi:hypothetical protein